MKTVYTSPHNWVTVKAENGIYWAERKGVNSVAVIPYRWAGPFIEFMQHEEPIIAHQKFAAKNIGAIGGSIDKDLPLADIACEELLEEGGYDISFTKMIPLGRMFCTTQSSEQVFLYTCNLTDVIQGEMQLEPSEMAQGKHDNHWVKGDWKTVNKCLDPRYIVAVSRIKEYLNYDG